MRYPASEKLEIIRTKFSLHSIPISREAAIPQT